MEARVMNIETLPIFISEKFNAPKVSVQEREGGIFLAPIKEGGDLQGKKSDMDAVRSLRGILKGTDYTHEKIRNERLGKYLDEPAD